MLQFVTGILVSLVAIIVLRRLVGIRHGRWATTLAAVLVANAAAIEILRIVYGDLSDVPGRAMFGAWALLTIFALCGVLVVELLSRQRVWRRRGGVPHPIRGTRAVGGRILRYIGGWQDLGPPRAPASRC